MKFNRRKFIGATATGVVALSLPKISVGLPKISVKDPPIPFDPWIEVDSEAIKYNIRQLYSLSNNRPIIAVVKNNGYGLGAELVSQILQDSPEVMGLAAVKAESCLSLRKSGLKKPILHMGMVTDDEALDLVSNDIQVSISNPDSPRQFTSIAEKLNKPVSGHIYLDTGMSRMGIPYQKAAPIIENLLQNQKIQIQGAFSGLTEDSEYDREQLKRLKDLNGKIKSKKLSMGVLHMASSQAVYHFKDSHLDAVRPGMSIYGGYPTDGQIEEKMGVLKVGFKLKARVVRVEQLREGDSVSYGRKYVADKPTWIATLPIGHADGYPRNAVKGAKVLIGDRLYPVIGAVSASHTILEIGSEPSVKIGDVATLYGSEDPSVNPNHISATIGTSIYDIYMHLNPKLPKKLV
ncbi:MAG: alanine racemase [Cyclobacteriaceae bacterium]